MFDKSIIRSKYWLYWLYIITAAIGVGILFGLVISTLGMTDTEQLESIEMISMISSIIVIPFAFIITLQRINDTGLPKWVVLGMFIPIPAAGILFHILVGLIPTNQFNKELAGS